MFKDGFNSNSTPVVSARIRDHYGAIHHSILPHEITALVNRVKRAAGWITGIAGMRKGGFESRNIDVYGYDVNRNLAVIQIRRARKEKASYFTKVTKVYALVGLDEEQIFSHPLAVSPCRNKNLIDMSPEQVVEWAESKIFGVPMNKLHTILRQGDVALVPVRSIPGEVRQTVVTKDETGLSVLTLRGSHKVQVEGDLYHSDQGIFYAEGVVEIIHIKGEHKSVLAEGKFKIVPGEVGNTPWWIDAEMGD